jgi:MoaA/NifB/PqqE/SkfB family radical SAM enzyme
MHKVVRFLKFLRDFMRDKSFPRVANYEIASTCNLNCSHCYWRKGSNAKEELSDEQWREVFTEHNSRGVAFAFLTGGEPTLRLNVIEMADRIFKGLSIASNGVIRVPDKINRRIFISLDGPKEVHNRIRGAEVFDRVIANVRDDKRVILSPTLSTTNYRHIDYLVDLARETNVAGITFALYTSHTTEHDPLMLAGEELEWTIDTLRRSWKKNRDIMFLTPFIINLLKNKEHQKDCFFRGKNFVSFDPRLNKKIPCVLGEGVNCGTCGCLVPVVSHALKKGNFRSWMLINKLFPERYFKNNS